MDGEYKGIIGVILAVILGLSFTVNSIIFTDKITRRSADDVVKIRKAEVLGEEERLAACLEAGGLPNFYQNRLTGCKKK